MRIEVVEAPEQAQPILNNLAQFYLYDFTDFYPWDVLADGRFEVRLLGGCWTSDYRHPFLIHVDGQLAGFVIIDGRSHFTGGAGVWDVGEFFVMRKYRRRGVGEQVARLLFNRFRGRWEVRQLVKNVDAQAFWRKVIGRYTNGQFEEVPSDDSRWRGPGQFFDNRLRDGDATNE